MSVIVYVCICVCVYVWVQVGFYRVDQSVQGTSTAVFAARDDVLSTIVGMGIGSAAGSSIGSSIGMGVGVGIGLGMGMGVGPSLAQHTFAAVEKTGSLLAAALATSSGALFRLGDTHFSLEKMKEDALIYDMIHETCEQYQVC